MMRSLFSGVAGLKTHQTTMDVIGNHIANVNTVGFKSSSIVFAALLSQTTQRASGPNATTGTGGTNARQIGLGVKAGAININITGQGSAQSTGNPFDIMIEGDNFFVVNNGTENLFTRDGSFYVDAAGNLAMTSTGYNVMGWQVDPETMDIKQDTVTALRIMSEANLTYPAEATSQAYMAGILDKNDKDATSSNGKVVNLQFFDALGYRYTAKFSFKKSDKVAGAGSAPPQDVYSLELVGIQDDYGNEVPGVAKELFGDPASTQYKAGKISFDSANYEWDGKVLRKKGVTGDDGVVVDISTLIDGDAIKSNREEEITAGGKTITVQDGLDALAKAYGFEGSTDEFLAMMCRVNTGTDAAPNLEEFTISQMLVNLNKGNATDANALPTFPNPDPDEDYTFETVGRKFTGISIHFNSNNGEFYGVNGQPTVSSRKLNLFSGLESAGVAGLGGNFSDITIDFSHLSEPDNKGTSTAGATSGSYEGYGAGRRLGKMIGVSIQQDGKIYSSYDNGMTKLLGQIATASFANASGLEKHGDNLYSATLNSGEFDGIGVNITANGGKMSTGQLEMSNVDLSSEFTEMITTQRGFQANSRIITVSDTLLEELTNLKR